MVTPTLRRLNNMLMQVAQLLEEACRLQVPLLLPQLDPDPQSQQRYKRGVDMWQVLDTTHLVTSLRQCAPKCGRAVETLPTVTKRHGRKRAAWARLPWRVLWKDPVPITAVWDRGSLISCVYASARPSKRVEHIVNALEAEAVARAGARWAAMHLPIEVDLCPPRMSSTAYPLLHSHVSAFVHNADAPSCHL